MLVPVCNSSSARDCKIQICEICAAIPGWWYRVLCSVATALSELERSLTALGAHQDLEQWHIDVVVAAPQLALL